MGGFGGGFEGRFENTPQHGGEWYDKHMPRYGEVADDPFSDVEAQKQEANQYVHDRAALEEIQHTLEAGGVEVDMSQAEQPAVSDMVESEQASEKVLQEAVGDIAPPEGIDREAYVGEIAEAITEDHRQCAWVGYFLHNDMGQTITADTITNNIDALANAVLDTSLRTTNGVLEYIEQANSRNGADSALGAQKRALYKNALDTLQKHITQYSAL